MQSRQKKMVQSMALWYLSGLTIQMKEDFAPWEHVLEGNFSHLAGKNTPKCFFFKENLSSNP